MTPDFPYRDFPYANQGDCVFRDEPGRTAIVSYQGGRRRQISFRDFDRLVDNAVNQLLGRGAGDGDRVAIVAKNSIEYLAAFLAAMRAGLVSVPLSYKFPPATLAYALDNSGAAIVLVDDSARLDGVDHDGQVATLEQIVAPAPARRRFHRGPQDAAMILYTSGSTGNPKGVELSQASHLWVMAQGYRAERPRDRTIAAAPLYHMNALANAQGTLLNGDLLVLLDVFDARGFLRAIADEKVNRITGVPPMMALALHETDLTSSLDLSGVTEVFLGSAPASKDLLEATMRLFSNGWLSYGYGTTESGPVAFTNPRPGGQFGSPIGSVGRANPAVDLRLVDADGAAHPERDGLPDKGVLEIRCPALLTGYWNRPDLSRPVTGDGFYHTKDVFRRDADGFYFFEGREDDMFASGGENVYPRAVESVLEAHPDVREAAVVALPDPDKGARPVAFVVPTPGTRPTEQELRHWSLERLEPYAHPRRVFLVDELPLSGTNKVDKAGLARRAVDLTTPPPRQARAS